MSSHNHRFPLELRAAILGCAIVAKRQLDHRKNYDEYVERVREYLEDRHSIMNEVSQNANSLDELRATRRYSGLAQQYRANLTRQYEEINFAFVALEDFYTASIQEINGYNIQLLAHLLCYTGDDRAAARTLFLIEQKYHALRQECNAMLDALPGKITNYRASLKDTSVDEILEEIVLSSRDQRS